MTKVFDITAVCSAWLQYKSLSSPNSSTTLILKILFYIIYRIYYCIYFE